MKNKHITSTELTIDDSVETIALRRWNLYSMFEYWSDRYVATGDCSALETAMYLEQEIEGFETLALHATKEGFHEVRRLVRQGYLPKENLAVMLR